VIYRANRGVNAVTPSIVYVPLLIVNASRALQMEVVLATEEARNAATFHNCIITLFIRLGLLYYNDTSK